MFEYESLKPWLFKLQPESAHTLATALLRSASFCPPLFNGWMAKHFISHPSLTQELFGRTFLNPVGLAAGFDKNATMFHGVQAMGFGFTEIGTLTPKPQEGNPRPRLWRHIEEESLQNAMGFNNDGVFQISHRLKTIYPFSTPIGVNIGKNKITPDDKAIKDYTMLIKALHEYADYMVINISSPNTPGLRDLQNEAFITQLFSEAKALTQKPILLKIAPDMSENQAVALCVHAVMSGADGIIATNTTIDYSLVAEPEDMGGLSGEVLRERSFYIFDAIARELYGKTTLISVGGIATPEEAYRRIRAGASLVQLYTSLIFKGPEVVEEINSGLIDLLASDGFSSIAEAIGADRR
ncbi:quinone-dependent dihydroorotate dehydrogenase [Sulfuricurvum sp.]|uniref:quinone-dependent dihydroorotate dehydrogenase n=1 Tax=Sulfuricurvum sp. TaxID=2025608 RepID=UPI0019991BB1|nr:quinone-dependent dihydroorotate dehydrogenase [Sulfuricurvum sp.]MBD3798578.1 quinone-dependent dihydroorotate dehydrogenase [Campylobacterota bacterium]MBD3806133.1 quinone-dependent dihydroorotate dehydrogenase [Sulfuricurvum sp.]